jgi:ketosteroid isomerase-like protein
VANGKGTSGRAKRRKKAVESAIFGTVRGEASVEVPVVAIEGPIRSAAAEAQAPVAPSPRAMRKPRAGESDREAVLAANAMFYRSFEVGDLELMGQLWANTPYVRCIHPGREPLYGWEEVVGSWGQIFAGMETLRFTLGDVSVRVGGDLAWVELSELLEALHEGKPAHSQVLATNLFERGADGRWRLIHHHASPILARQPASRRGGPSLH